MNRSILIVICDFLLVSLLAFSTVDINKVANEGVKPEVKLNIATNQVDRRQDLTAVMRLALDDERKGSDWLRGELAKSRDTSSQQQALLTEREKQIQAFQQQLQSREQQALRLQQEQTNLQQQIASARSNIQALDQQWKASAAEALISKERLAAMEAESRKQQEQAAALQQQLGELEKSRQAVLADKQQLATQLQVAEAEKHAATQQLAKMHDEVKIEREEKAVLTRHADKLADGVKALATKSGELVQEIRENRPLAPNTIFAEFATNRVHARFYAFRSGFLGLDSTRRRETEAVLVTDGTNTYALCHVEDTPLVFANPATEWESLTGTLGRNAALLSVGSLSFCLLDARVVFMPITAAQARDLGCKIYQISPSPFKFQEAVLVGAREGYYGECKFEVDLTTPQYVKMDRSFFKGLFGKFNPSRGDLVFSKTGELLGVMANNTYCVMIHKFEAAATIQLGPDVRAQHTGEILSRLHSLMTRVPFKLQ